MNHNRKLVAVTMLLVLLCGLLVGSTYALINSGYIYDSSIQAGSLAVDLYWSPDMTNWYNAQEKAVFSGGLWEPGHTQVRYFKVVNSGTLEFQYTLSLLSDSGLGELAKVIDVYLVRTPDGRLTDRNVLTSAEYLGTMDSVNGALASGAVLAQNQSDPSYATGSHTFALILKMQEQADNRYNGMELGTFAIELRAEQFSYGGPLTVSYLAHLVDGVLEQFPQAAIPGSSGVVFKTAPYAYTDTSLFTGKTIQKIGIPVKSVKAVDENQTFTLSVVRTDESTYNSVDNYSYVNQYVLTLPKDQLDGIYVNDWVYVDVSALGITVGANQTLAFGAPTDTVTWGYLGSRNNSYAFRSSDGKWGSSNSASIFFDVIAKETLTFEPSGDELVATVFDGQVLPNVLTAFPEASIAGGNTVDFSTPPYAYTNTYFSGKTITKIGIPVKTVKALDENQTFTLSVVKTTSTAYSYVNQHVLKLPKEQLGDSTTVNKWVYVDVTDLNIHLGEDETLAFGGKNDTVTWGWKNGYADSKYYFRNVNQAWNTPSGGIFFDVHAKQTLTYEDYQAFLEEEAEKAQDALEQQAREEALKTILSGKKISILGDSISTFAGYSNNTSYNSTIGSNAVYYSGSNYITDVNETWWMQTIQRTGTSLLVNNSWSGDTATGRGISRALQLHNSEGATPDLIAVYLGINDFRTKVTAEAFATAYGEMIRGMKEKYPNAQVYLFTLVYTTNVNSGVNPADVVKFNEVIEAAATTYDCGLVDLYNDSGITKDTMAANMGDGNLHPNYAGMDKITDCFMDVLYSDYVTPVEGANP